MTDIKVQALIDWFAFNEKNEYLIGKDFDVTWNWLDMHPLLWTQDHNNILRTSNNLAETLSLTIFEVQLGENARFMLAIHRKKLLSKLHDFGNELMVFGDTAVGALLDLALGLKSLYDLTGEPSCFWSMHTGSLSFNEIIDNRDMLSSYRNVSRDKVFFSVYPFNS